MRKLTEKDVEFVVECLPEEETVVGNALASGDDEEDARAEQKIIRDYNNGNEWAWCIVKVTAKWHDFEASDYLGACSYASRESFMKPGGYYDDMRQTALDDLNDIVAEAGEQLKELAD